MGKFHAHASTVNLSERVKYDPRRMTSSAVIPRCSDVYQLNLQRTRD